MRPMFRPAWALIAITLFTAAASAQRSATIAEVQGDKARSPLENQAVKVQGIVTARRALSFYIQTPDDKADANNATSEGIQVFFGQDNSCGCEIGDLVEVSGTVVEYVSNRGGEKYGLPITELTKPTVRVISSKNPLPAPITLTAAEMAPRPVDALERFEGMRVRVDSMSVTGATGGDGPDERNKYKMRSDGVFFATVSGIARPFREPGVDVHMWLALKLPNTVPWFDGNPEVVRVDTDAQLGAKPVIVTAGATVKNVVGVLDYGLRRYTILVDATANLVVEGNKSYTAVSPAGEREITVGAFNIENFFDDEKNSDDVDKEAVVPKDFFQKRLNKASLAIRKVLSTPDVLGIVEVENLKVLRKLAAKINADAVAAGSPDPKYEAYVEDGNDPRGIDSGFLVRTNRVKVLETKQLAKDQLLVMGSKGGSLFDRPPYMVRVQAIDPQNPEPLTVTAIVNHFKSYGGIDDEKDGFRVREKRKQEADWLAQYVADRQKADPNESTLR